MGIGGCCTSYSLSIWCLEALFLLAIFFFFFSIMRRLWSFNVAQVAFRSYILTILACSWSFLAPLLSNTIHSSPKSRVFPSSHVWDSFIPSTYSVTGTWYTGALSSHLGEICSTIDQILDFAFQNEAILYWVVDQPVVRIIFWIVSPLILLERLIPAASRCCAVRVLSISPSSFLIERGLSSLKLLEWGAVVLILFSWYFLIRDWRFELQ